MNTQTTNFTTTDINPIKLIDSQELQQLCDRDSVLLIDVREPVENKEEKIAGSILLPLSRFDPSQIPNLTNKKLVLYCRSSNRSAQAAQKLIAAGYSEVTHLKGGLLAWKEQGMPLQVHQNAPISLMRQVQIVAGFLVFTGTVLGAFVSPWFLLLSGFVGAGLMFAGITNTCAMGMLLAKLPYNQ